MLLFISNFICIRSSMLYYCCDIGTIDYVVCFKEEEAKKAKKGNLRKDNWLMKVLKQLQNHTSSRYRVRQRFALE